MPSTISFKNEKDFPLEVEVTVSPQIVNLHHPDERTNPLSIACWVVFDNYDVVIDNEFVYIVDGETIYAIYTLTAAAMSYMRYYSSNARIVGTRFFKLKRRV